MRLEPCYLLAGPESGKRAAFIAELRAAITREDGSPPEEHRLYAGDAGVGELLSLLRNGSLFASRRLVEYRGAEAIKGKDDTGALAAYIAAPAPDAILLLVTDAFYVEKAIEEAVGKNRKQTFFELFESEKPRWVERRLRELGLAIDEDGIEALLELVENDTAALDAACARLGVLFPAGTQLGEAEIEAAIARNRQEDAFSLFARMVEDDPAWALECLDAVLADRQGGAVQILSALAWSFRRLLRLRILLDAGESFDAACLNNGIRAKSLKDLHRLALARYTREDCERIIRLALEVDARTRAGGAALERPLLQLFVYGCMIKKGALELEPPPLAQR